MSSPATPGPSSFQGDNEPGPSGRDRAEESHPESAIPGPSTPARLRERARRQSRLPPNQLRRGRNVVQLHPGMTVEHTPSALHQGAQLLSPGGPRFDHVSPPATAESSRRVALEIREGRSVRTINISEARPIVPLTKLTNTCWPIEKASTLAADAV